MADILDQAELTEAPGRAACDALGNTAEADFVRLENPTPRVPQGLPRRVGLKSRGLDFIAALFSECCGPREAKGFGVLMYHRVVEPPPRVPRPTWNVPPRLLERQLTGLLARGWQPWPLRQIIDCLERELPIPRKTFVVTFDDGYANNLTQACPILTRLRVPATVFIATAYLDTKEPLPSDDWPAAGRPGVPSESWRALSTDECRRLAANGLIELGAHTHTHGDFREQPEAFARDLRRNLEELRRKFGVERPALALPYGTRCDGFASPELCGVAREVGVSCVLTTEPAIVRPGDSPFGWGRFAAEDHDTARTLAARLGGWPEAVRRLARPRRF